MSDGHGTFMLMVVAHQRSVVTSIKVKEQLRGVSDEVKALSNEIISCF
jgi:hypothetical protein